MSLIDTALKYTFSTMRLKLHHLIKTFFGQHNFFSPKKNIPAILQKFEKVNFSDKLIENNANRSTIKFKETNSSGLYKCHYI